MSNIPHLFFEESFAKLPRWDQICDPPPSASESWDYRHHYTQVEKILMEFLQIKNTISKMKTTLMELTTVKSDIGEKKIRKNLSIKMILRNETDKQLRESKDTGEH